MNVTHWLLKFIITCALGFCGLAAVAQVRNQVDPNGYNKFYYQSGTVSSEGPMTNGKPNGYWRTYYPTGVIKSEGKRSHFLLDSVWNFYTERGDTLEKIAYLAGKKNGYYLKFDSKEKGSHQRVVVSRELFVNDKREGACYTYYPSGAIKSMANYAHGALHGETRQYTEQGMVHTVLSYHKGHLVAQERVNRTDANGLKQGVWKFYGDNGRLSYEKSYWNDQLHGYFKTYDPTGNLVSTIRYRKGEVVAEAQQVKRQEVKVQQSFYSSGVLKTSGAYRAGKPVGVHREYNEAGKIKAAFTYSTDGVLEAKGIVSGSGNKHGDWEYYYPDNKLKAKGRYRNNRREGPWVFYFADGTLEQQGAYVAGKPDGDWHWFYPDKRPLRNERFVNGEVDGPYVEYGPQGQILVQGSYVDGRREGPWLYRVGDQVEQGNYQSGLRNGNWVHYYLPDSTLSYQGEYVQGNAVGRHHYYHTNGKVMLEGKFLAGQKDKDWQYFDENGLLVLTKTYRKGELVRIDGVKVKDDDDEQEEF